YDLVAAPTNVNFWTALGRPDELFAVIAWETPSRAEVGRTNVFIIRATDHGTPPVSSTLSVSFILADPPPIEAIVMSNGVPALRFSNPIPIQPVGVPAQSYRVLWSADLALTNWSPLCAVSSGAPLITISDTNGVMPRRYYKLVPDGGWFYGFGAP
ncbi:MAG: hypothetical protein NT154_40755, partial [Verrucomicrobia bacterium]|nr:hypothetical protein [Verrucomicrobiota bacterium]